MLAIVGVIGGGLGCQDQAWDDRWDDVLGLIIAYPLSSIFALYSHFSELLRFSLIQVSARAPARNSCSAPEHHTLPGADTGCTRQLANNPAATVRRRGLYACLAGLQ